jgi:hypothetical protein
MGSDSAVRFGCQDEIIALSLPRPVEERMELGLVLPGYSRLSHAECIALWRLAVPADTIDDESIMPCICPGQNKYGGGLSMNVTFEGRKRMLSECKSMAALILEGLRDTNVNNRLDTLSRLEDLPDLSADREMKEMKDYAEVKGILKKLYIEAARAIMKILDTYGTFDGDPAASFNYKEPREPIRAAESIRLLPNAFIAGPMKSAIANQQVKVRKIAIEYYDSLPTDLRYSGIFPEDFPNVVKKAKSELPG